jgi:phosphoglycerate dehydrogenase-like enzyme
MTTDAARPAPFGLGVTADIRSAAGTPVFGGARLDALRPAIQWHFLSDSRPALEARDLKGLDGLLHFSSNRVTAEALAAAEDLLVIARLGAGYDLVDVDACTRGDVLVTIEPEPVRRPMAAGAMAMILALGHNLRAKDAAVRAGAWSTRLELTGYGIAGRTLGIIGLGNIGQEIARLAASFSMPVVAYGPRLTEEVAAAAGARAVGLEQLLAEADYVCLCCPLTPETRGLLSRRRLGQMKPGAFLVNVARGGLVDEGALAELLASGRLAGAGLDVFEQEPPPVDSALLGLDNVVLAPHAVGYTDDLLGSLTAAACSSLTDLLGGRAVRHPVNKVVLDQPGFRAKLARFLPGPSTASTMERPR